MTRKFFVAIFILISAFILTVLNVSILTRSMNYYMPIGFVLSFFLNIIGAIILSSLVVSKLKSKIIKFVLIILLSILLTIIFLVLNDVFNYSIGQFLYFSREFQIGEILIRIGNWSLLRF